MTTLGTNQQLNQFRQTAVRGSLDELYNFNNVPGKIVNTSAIQETVAGDMVVMTSGAEYVPVYREVVATDTVASLTNTLKGFVVKNLKNGILQNKDQTTVGVALEGSVMRMIAEEAIASGAQVAYDATTTTPANTGKVLNNPATAVAGQIPCGYALDTAKQDGDLIRVYIKF